MAFNANNMDLDQTAPSGSSLIRVDSVCFHGKSILESSFNNKKLIAFTLRSYTHSFFKKKYVFQLFLAYRCMYKKFGYIGILCI